MDAASRSPSGPLVAFLLRRKWEKYRDSLITPLLPRGTMRMQEAKTAWRAALQELGFEL